MEHRDKRNGVEKMKDEVVVFHRDAKSRERVARTLERMGNHVVRADTAAAAVVLQKKENAPYVFAQRESIGELEPYLERFSAPEQGGPCFVFMWNEQNNAELIEALNSQRAAYYLILPGKRQEIEDAMKFARYWRENV